MALDYHQSAQLRTNIQFNGRIASAALKWADSILANTAIDVTNLENRKSVNYSQTVYRDPNGEASKLQPIVVQDPAVQAQDLDPATGDSLITDAYLQSAVESAIHKTL
jgi:hypothetical protein